jgi:predicted NBD/HSP70 family sugar kinase
VATHQSIRYLNETRALDALFRYGRCSRAELSRRLGLTRSTAGSIVTDLVALGLVREEEDPEPDAASGRGRVNGRTGRPGVGVALDPAGAAFIGAEIGVERLTVVTTDLLARMTGWRSRTFDTPAESPEATVQAVCDIIAELSATLPRSQMPRGICVCLPALLGHDGQVVNGLLLGWREVPLLTMLADRLGSDVPLAIENDANAFAVAESYGAEVEPTDTRAFLLIESGVGGGIILGGRLFRGGSGLAGEFGQTVVGIGPEDEKLSSLRTPRGHLEAHVGKTALLSRWWAHTGRSGGDLDDLLSALEAGDGATLECARHWGRRLATGLVQVTAVLNPDSIVIGGSVSAVLPYVEGVVAKALAADLLEGYPPPPVRRSALGIEGAALGAAHLMHQKLFTVDETRLLGSAFSQDVA